MEGLMRSLSDEHMISHRFASVESVVTTGKVD